MPTTTIRGACPHDCPDTCALLTTVEDGRAVRVQGNPAHAATGGVLCAKVSRYAERTHHAERILTPLRRSGPKGSGRFTPVSWDEALAFTAENLRRIVAEHGADSVGVLGSARATNEDNYLTQKFARVVLGTNNVDCCARVCHAPSAAALSAISRPMPRLAPVMNRVLPLSDIWPP
jgi:anaerobic selenocysteine-containing dehydrogenase